MAHGEPIVTKYFRVAANKKPGTRSCQQEVVNVYLVDSCDLGLDELVVFYVIGCEVSAFIVFSMIFYVNLLHVQHWQVGIQVFIPS